MDGAQPDLFSAIDPPDGVPEEVSYHFERLALDVVKAGFDRFSADMVLHRIRWYVHVEQGNRDFKCNNNWTAPLARWFLARHPELPEFFELRASPKKKNTTGVLDERWHE